MEGIQVLATNLVSPPVVVFFAGVLAKLCRSDLKFPSQVYDGLSIYLLLAIGFKGGASLLNYSLGQLALPILGVFFVGCLFPPVVYLVARRGLRVSVADSAALAAHYGSVSAVTFMACLSFLDYQEITYETYMPALMALMEIPAILVALLLAHRLGENQRGGMGDALKEVFTGKSIVLLITGLVAGLAAGAEGFEKARAFLVDPFYGVLVLFLLEMGLVAGSQLRTLGKTGFRLIIFALGMTLFQGMIGLLVGKAAGLSQGGTVAFMTLCASASYIAAPAAVRVAIPKANAGLYVTASLGITFPFNLLLGIPLYGMLASWYF